MARTVAVANQKGGVGKTTTSVNVAAGLAKAGRRVLLVDLDPQGNATMGSGIDKRKVARTVYHALLGLGYRHASQHVDGPLLGLGDIATIRLPSPAGGYDLVPANRDLAGAEVELVDLPNREARLRSALERIAPEYDFELPSRP